MTDAERIAQLEAENERLRTEARAQTLHDAGINPWKSPSAPPSAGQPEPDIYTQLDAAQAAGDTFGVLNLSRQLATGLANGTIKPRPEPTDAPQRFAYDDENLDIDERISMALDAGHTTAVLRLHGEKFASGTLPPEAIASIEAQQQEALNAGDVATGLGLQIKKLTGSTESTVPVGPPVVAPEVEPTLEERIQAAYERGDSRTVLSLMAKRVNGAA